MAQDTCRRPIRPTLLSPQAGLPGIWPVGLGKPKAKVKVSGELRTLQIWKDTSLTGWMCASESAGGCLWQTSPSSPGMLLRNSTHDRPPHKHHTGDGNRDPATEVTRSWPPPLETLRHRRARTRKPRTLPSDPSPAGRRGCPSQPSARPVCSEPLRRIPGTVCRDSDWTS